MAEREELLRFENFGLTRGAFQLRDISFTLCREEVLCFLGKTGAGKTLLLESAAGFYSPDTGRVLYQGTEVSAVPLHRRNIGYLYQDYSLFPKNDGAC